MRVLDLTHTIAENMPVYPGTETPIFAGANTYEKDGFKETKLTMYTHTGTHMDPPAHLFAGRTTLDAFPASQFIGKALVIECSDLNEGKAITLERILQYGKDAENADFLLFHLGWDKRWGTDAYFGDYPCLDDAALDYISAGLKDAPEAAPKMHLGQLQGHRLRRHRPRPHRRRKPDTPQKALPK